jgi:hypothetical protein
MNKLVIDMNETDILNNAIHNLEKKVPIKWNWSIMGLHQDLEVDRKLELTLNEKTIILNVEIKKDLKNHQMFNLFKYNNRFQNFLLVAEKLFPKVREELRNNKINYLEGNGNAYINQEDIFIYIDTNKTIKQHQEKGNRAFTKTGLKVVFHFLLNPELINQKQREIAETANVALGNIPLIINGLLDTNLILKLKKNEYVINNYEDLLNKWITEFPQTLKPTIFKQRFRFQNENQEWQTLQLNTEKTVWGGEPAGDILTNHLRPEKFILYTKETTKDLMINYRLTPDVEGYVWAYDMFWTYKENNDIAPIELVYADLMINGDKRSRETAKMILDEYIRPNI